MQLETFITWNSTAKQAFPPPPGQIGAAALRAAGMVMLGVRREAVQKTSGKVVKAAVPAARAN